MTSKFAKMFTSILTNTTTDKIIAVADAARQNLIDMGVTSDKIEVIINGVMPMEKYGASK